MKRAKFRKFKLKKYYVYLSLLPGATAVILAACVGFWGVSELKTHSVLKRAHAALDEGYKTLPAEMLDPYRFKLVHRQRGCKVLLEAYTQASEAKKLAWTAESCMSAGFSGPEYIMGLAVSYELQGNDVEAIKILDHAQNVYPQSPEFRNKIDEIQVKNQKRQTASTACQEAITSTLQRSKASMP